MRPCGLIWISDTSQVVRFLGSLSSESSSLVSSLASYNSAAHAIN